MQDKLILNNKIKKTIIYVEKIIDNFPNKYYVLKDKIILSFYQLLELAYKANIHKEKIYMKEILVKIRMIEYYIKVSFNKKLISYKKFDNIGKYLLEINKMVNSWIIYEKNKQYL